MTEVYLKPYCRKLLHFVVHGSLLPRADRLPLVTPTDLCFRIFCTEKQWHPVAVPSGAAVLALAAASTTLRTRKISPRINLARSLTHGTRRGLRRPTASTLPTAWNRGLGWAPPSLLPPPNSRPLRPALPGRGLCRARRRLSPGNCKG